LNERVAFPNRSLNSEIEKRRFAPPPNDALHPAKAAIKMRSRRAPLSTPLRRAFPAQLYRNQMQQPKTRIEIRARSEFWRNAVLVEWNHRFPQRLLESDPQGFYLIEDRWLDDLRQTAAQCFGRVLLAPHDPGRRRIFRMLFSNERS
jgi:hypothetical protein